MSVEFIPAGQVRALTQRVQEARQRAVDGSGPPPSDDTDAVSYWEALFEANAAAVLAAQSSVTLPADRIVRYRFFGARGRDLLVRPFVARATTEIETVRQLIDWHPAPDSVAESHALRPSSDVDLLYRHFSFPRTALGFFEYWLLMQEIWASHRWAYSNLIASAPELSQVTGSAAWQILQPVEVYEPAVVMTDGGARLAVLIACPIERFAIHLEQIEIAADQSVLYAPRVLVASGPRGYMA